MLEFWFDPTVSILKKIGFLILLTAVSIGLYLYQPLTAENILFFAGTGIIFLICRYCKIHFASKNPTGFFYRLLTWIPLALFAIGTTAALVAGLSGHSHSSNNAEIVVLPN